MPLYNPTAASHRQKKSNKSSSHIFHFLIGAKDKAYENSIFITDFNALDLSFLSNFIVFELSEQILWSIVMWVAETGKN